jgi:hypothetical protein
LICNAICRPKISTRAIAIRRNRCGRLTAKNILAQ